MMAMASPRTELSRDEIKFINDAAQYLENPTFLMQLANLVGVPLEMVLKGIDKIAPDMVDEAVRNALNSALKVAVYTIPSRANDSAIVIPENINDVGANVGFWHKVAVAGTGAGGGLLGIGGLAAELPTTTTIMFRSIASIAQEFGEDLADTSVRLQCLTVLTMGGPNPSDEAMECTYLEARVGLQAVLSKAATAVAGLAAEELATMIQKGTAPAVVAFIARVASQFGVTVTQKLVFQLLPVVGALGGATINVAFMDHFNTVARFHFGISSLERKYGQDHIHSIYRQTAIANKLKPKALGPALGSTSG